MDEIRQLGSSLWQEYSEAPLFLRVAVWVFAAGGLLDLSYHGLSPLWPGKLEIFLGPDGYYAHLLLFAGMVLVTIGVILSSGAARASHPGNQQPGKKFSQLDSERK